MMRFGFASAAMALALAASVPAGGQDPMSRDDLRSAFRSAHSFAAESQMFLESILSGQPPRIFAEQHAAMLEEQIGKSAGELDRQTAPPEFAGLLRECRAQLRELALEISSVRSHQATKKSLAAARDRIAQMAARLGQIAASL